MFARACALALILAAASAGTAAAAAVTFRASLEPDGSQRTNLSENPAISADGRLIAYEVLEGEPRAGQIYNDIYVYDRTTGTTEWVSAGLLGMEGDGSSENAAISADGRFVAYQSSSSNLVPGDTNGRRDIFVRDRLTGELERIADPRPGGGSGYYPSLSPHGRYVAFESIGRRADIGGAVRADVLLHDRATDETETVSAGRKHSGDPSVSEGGRFVAYTFNSGVRVRDRERGETELIPGRGARDIEPEISASGRFVAFTSTAYYWNSTGVALVHDRKTGLTRRVSVAHDGGDPNGHSGGVSISPDGRYAAFVSEASNLVRGDTNGEADVFRRDRRTNTTRRVSVSTARTQGNHASGGGGHLLFYSAISARGRFVAFGSDATNLVAGDTNGKWDVFGRGPLAP